MIKELVRDSASLIYWNPCPERVKKELGYQDQYYFMPPQTHPFQQTREVRYNENKSV
jgi:hypothetical protein